MTPLANDDALCRALQHVPPSLIFKRFETERQSNCRRPMCLENERHTKDTCDIKMANVFANGIIAILAF